MKKLIELDAAIDVVDKRIRQIGYEDNALVLSIRQAVRDIEPVDAVPVRHGRWLIRSFGSDAKCSECGMYFSDAYDMENSDNYCRHCGTKMNGLKLEDEADV